MLACCQEGPHTPGFPFNALFPGEVRQLSPGKMNLVDVEAVVLWGGTDISPALYGEKANKFCEVGDYPSRRDIFEWDVMRECKRLGIPLIGVCRGAQIMCAFDGGKLAQDVSHHMSGHTVVTNNGELFNAPASHHQMMLPREGNELLAWASKLPGGARRVETYIGEGDAITIVDEKFKEPEAVYFPDLKGVGFQFHPEWDHKDSVTVKWCLEVVKEKLL